MLARCEEIRKKCAGSSKPVNHRYIEVTVPPAPISPPIFASAGCLEEPACTRGDLLEQSPGRIGRHGIAIYATKYGRCHDADRAKQAWRGPARFVRVDRSARRREARPRAVAHSPAGSAALLRRLGARRRAGLVLQRRSVMVSGVAASSGWPGGPGPVHASSAAAEVTRSWEQYLLDSAVSPNPSLPHYLNPLPFTPGH